MTNQAPDGYTHIELPKPQARGWEDFWATINEALDEPEKQGEAE